MSTRQPQEPRRHRSLPARPRMPLARRLVLVGALIGGFGMGSALIAHSPASIASAASAATMSSLADITPLDSHGGPWQT